MTVDLHSKFVGAMLGAALGDAVGELAFQHPDRNALLAQLEQTPQLRYTDDTVMSVVVAEHLIEHGDINPQILGHQLREHYHKEPWRGYGESTRYVFSLVENEGIGYIDAALRLHGGTGTYGNGAAMRVAPVALRWHDSADLYDKVAASSRVTHAHPVAIDAAATLALAQARMLALNPQRPFSPPALLGELIAGARTAPIREKLERIPPLLDGGLPQQQIADILGRGTAAHESLPFALYCFLTHPHEFMECVLCAVLNGGDRDTLGTMAGAVAGALLGSEALPQAWLAKLENRQHIETLARELAARDMS
jgi:poly(ADP-ribose) glycohydrolase ARH3